MKAQNKKLLLLGILTMSLFSASLWKTPQASAEESQTTASTTKDDLNDPEYYKYHSDTYNDDKTVDNQKSRATTFSTLTTFSGGKNTYTGGIEFRHNSRYQNYKIYDGIDVSKWQATIDWKKVKAAGIDYAFIRCGYSGLSNGSLNTDPYFTTNMINAKAAGVKIGVYYYSQSKTTAEATAEANYVLKLIEPYKSYISLPVVYDFETPDSSRAKDLTKTQVTNNTIAFCNTIENAGYYSMYYGSPSKLTASFDSSKLSRYPCWVANYCYQTTTSFYTKYTDSYLFWQYSDFGKVNGISGNVDMNFYYAASSTNNYVTTGRDNGPYAGTPNVSGSNTSNPSSGSTSSAALPAVTGLTQKTNASTTITLSWNKNSSAKGYIIYRCSAPNGTYKRVKVITKNSTTSWKDSSLAKNRQYYYKIRAYQKADGKTTYSSHSSVVPGHTNTYSGRYRTATANLNVRSYPGTSYSRITTLAKNQKVQVLYKTMAKGGAIWYKISWSGKTGYVSGDYLK